MKFRRRFQMGLSNHVDVPVNRCIGSNLFDLNYVSSTCVSIYVLADVSYTH